MKKKPPRLFAVTPPGLEGLTAAELAEHGFRSRELMPGGVAFRGSPLKANRLLATASRVLMPVARFDAREFNDLVLGAGAVDWRPYGGLTPKVSSSRSRLYHTEAIAERLASVVPPGEGTLYCRLMHDRCVLQVDTTGEHLHRRGWRSETGSAPLRETLAARILRLAEWQPGEALVDPMCGSGTFAIEAAVRAAGLAPGRLRSFDCERWWRTELMPKGPATPTVILGNDGSKRAVASARRDAERAGVEPGFTVGPAKAVTPPAEAGLLVVSPPYSQRAEALEATWAELGALLTGPFAKWRAAILCPRPDLATHLGRPVLARHPLRNGGRRAELLLA